MELTSRALIINKNKILLIYRLKNEYAYFVLPGGHIEKGESEEETLIREIKEETNLKVKINKKLWEIVDKKNNSKHNIFLITSFSGKLRLGGPEIKRKSRLNVYKLEWVKLTEIESLNVLPKKLKDKIQEGYIN